MRTTVKSDPLLSPREVAELVLGHDQHPRSRRVIYNLQKRVQADCRRHLHRDADHEYFGLACEPPLPNGRLLIKKSEAVRWSDRLRLWRFVG